MVDSGVLVEFSDSDYVPSEDDRRVAFAYECVADLLDSVDESDAITLRLSTCRNAYLTANAVFVDLREMLGRGNTPPLLASALWHMRNRKWDKARGCLRGEGVRSTVGALLSEIGKKLEVWRRRDDLDAMLRMAMESPDRTLLVQGELKAVLFGEVRTTSSTPVEHDWDSKYLSLDAGNQTDADIDDVIQFLEALTRKLRAVYSVADSMCSYGDQQADLVSRNALGVTTDQPELWDDLFSIVSETADYWEAFVEEDQSDLCWRLADGTIVQFPLTEPQDGLTGVLDALLDRLGEVTGQVREELSKRFRPNISAPPLPKPFVIDLRPGTLDVELHRKCLDLQMVPISSPPQVKSVKVGLVGCEIPQELYLEHCLRAGSGRQDVIDMSFKAIDVAAAECASAVVFPEYFLPRGENLKPLRVYATEKNVVLIGGIEGGIIDGALRIRSVVSFPAKPREYHQEKQWHSMYEPTIDGDGEVKLFRDTPIGNFALVTCCDFAEIPMLKVLSEFAGILHHVFVLTRNPRHELFCQLALADCYRLYTHVAVVNSFPQLEVESNPARQTFVCCPARDAKSRAIDPDKSNLITVASFPAAIDVYTLSLEQLQGAVTEKPQPGVLTVPRCRRLIQKH